MARSESEEEPESAGRGRGLRDRFDGNGGSAARERLIRLMGEFQRRQRERPELVVRPWWTPGIGGDSLDTSAMGFVVEYCPQGVESAEISVWPDRARVEASSGCTEARLDLEEGWRLDAEDRHCPETVVNHLLWLADRLLAEAA